MAEAKIFLALACNAAEMPASVRGVTTTTRVATDGGQIVGFARTSSGAAELRTEVLDYVFVFERWRDCGVGSALVNDARVRAQVAGQICLQVVAQPWAELFFRGLGGRRVGWQPPTGTVGWSCPILSFDLRAESALTGRSRR